MEVKMNREARADFNSLDPQVQIAAIEEVRKLKRWPDVSGVKHLEGRWAGHARLKVRKDWRLLFRILTARARLVIIRIGHRSVVYDNPPK